MGNHYTPTHGHTLYKLCQPSDPPPSLEPSLYCIYKYYTPTGHYNQGITTRVLSPEYYQQGKNKPDTEMFPVHIKNNVFCNFVLAIPSDSWDLNQNTSEKTLYL